MTTTAAHPKRRIWLAALVAVLGLTGIVAGQAGPNRHRIENDLAHRSVQALAAAGQDDARVSFAGRDALVVTGSPAEADQVRTIVAAVTGVRAVHVSVEAAEVARTPAAVLLAASGERAVLTGTVPTAEMRTTLRDAADAAFGAGVVDDRLTVAGTVAADNALSALPALLRSLPAGVPDLSVRLEAGALTLSGTAPSEAARTALTTAAGRTGVPVTDRMTVAALQPRLSAVAPLTFRTGSAELTPASRKSLRQIADLLTANPSTDLRVEGHTDSRGSRATNLRVSRARADAVRSGLLKLGVAADRLSTVGYGEARPKVANDSPTHRAENRRVELAVVKS
ncbi:OmpA family protein [Actinoplanes regularis]|uniref:Outer membrane protein OmpA n=1 Tax=Actinoplanes regularis TaxID=52697 RepID=A0A238W198_9ACTN|nr:OmpA family protein [Actinoplanes regularis]GIE85365.1 hypothetical protein Are01nite_18450 [Actinoplanes regularis]SNR40171.1 Outer membrane protein OmpA [Actinoplanes regularis]